MTIIAADKTVVFDGDAKFISSRVDNVVDGGYTLIIEIYDSEGIQIVEPKDAGQYTFKYYVNNSPNYDVANNGHEAVLTIKKAEKVSFDEIIREGVIFNDQRLYVYDPDKPLIPELIRFDVEEKYGITFMACDTSRIFNAGTYSVSFKFSVSGNFEADTYVVTYTILPKPIEFKITRQNGMITVVNPVEGAMFRINGGEWQAAPEFRDIKSSKDYKVEMLLEGSAAINYDPDKTLIVSRAENNEIVIWIIVAVIIALLFALFFLIWKKRKKEKEQIPMGMMPFGPMKQTRPMPRTGQTLKKANLSPQQAQQLKKARVSRQKRETRPMIDMDYIKNTSLYGGSGEVERNTVHRDK